MAYTIKVGKIEITCDTAEEAIALLSSRSFSEVQRKVSRRGRAAGARDRSSSNGGRELDREELLRIRKTLKIIKNSGENGIRAEELRLQLGIEPPRKMGTFMGSVRKGIGLTGIPDEDVLLTSRDSRGRTWFAGPMLDACLDRLRRRLDDKPGEGVEKGT